MIHWSVPDTVQYTVFMYLSGQPEEIKLDKGKDETEGHGKDIWESIREWIKKIM